MINKIIKALNSKKDLAGWKIIATKRDTCELFFVLSKLETNRATSTSDYFIELYKDYDSKRGVGSANISSYMNDEEISKELDKAIFNTEFAKNEFFEIPGPTNKEIQMNQTNLDKKPLIDIAPKIAKAVFKADVYDEGWINSTEIFLNKNHVHFVNSKGIDISYDKYSGMIEVIPTWSNKKEEFELYKAINFGSVDLEEITSEVNDILLQSKARSEAVKLTEKMEINVIFRNKEVCNIFGSVIGNMSYPSEYQHMSVFELNSSLKTPDSKGDKFSAKLVPALPKSVVSSPIDGDGVVLSEVEVVKDSIAVAKFGSFRYGYYLGVKEPTGNLRNLVVSGGTKTIAEIKKEPYIECVSFSGLQVDLFSDYIGGEVRLGYYFDGNKVTPISGFSISGSLKNILDNMTLSKEEIEFSDRDGNFGGYHGPKYLACKLQVL